MGATPDWQPRIQGMFMPCFLIFFIFLIKNINIAYTVNQICFYTVIENLFICEQGEWKPKQIDNPDYKGKWVHPEIDNPEYTPDSNLYKYDDIGAVGFDLWQVRNLKSVWWLHFVSVKDTVERGIYVQ